MKKYLALFLLACVSSRKIDYFPQVKNSDFKKIIPLVYRASEDFFDQVVPGDTLAKESIARFSVNGLRNLSSSEDNQEMDDALSLCYQKKFEEGLAEFNRIYPKYKKYPSFWNQKGTCYYLQGNYKLALLHYNKSRDLDKTYAPPVNNLGVIYSEEGYDRKALLAFKQAADINKFSMTPIFNLAQLYLQYGFIEQAFNSFKLFYDKDPNDQDVLIGLANCYLFTQNVTSAIELFERVEEQRLREAYVALNYAVALKESDPSLAKKIYKGIDPQTINDRGYYTRVGQYIGI
jgi:Flp pilus assembly protein TadD